MYGVEVPAGQWAVMLHGNVFVQFLNEGGNRAAQQGGSINWAMAMARRRAGSGRVGLRAMFSLEPWTIRGCGYPDLLATGEVCNGEPIHDRQHPHDLIMELAAEYSRPLRGATRWQIYGGLVGEPALGPAAYPHRMSSMPNPLAPISHHWLDATHITFGVVTAGVSARRRGRSRARCSTAGSPTTTAPISISRRSTPCPAGVWYLPDAAAGAADLGGAIWRKRKPVTHAARASTSTG